MAHGSCGLYSPPWPPTLTQDQRISEAWTLQTRFESSFFSHLYMSIYYVWTKSWTVNMSWISVNSRKWSRHSAQSQNLGGWDWKAEFKASLGRCSSDFSCCCDQIPVKNNLWETGFCGLRVLGDKIHHGRKGIMNRGWGTARKQRDHRLDRISNIEIFPNSSFIPTSFSMTVYSPF